MAHNVTLSKKVENYLRNKILNRELHPNDKIIEQDIAEQMNVSRGPVRDALRTLMFEGLVDYKFNKGCTVTTLSPMDAYEIFFIRGSLEKLALRKNSGMLRETAVLKMEVALEQMKKSVEQNDLTLMIEADEMFHRQIIETGGMPRLTKMWQTLSPLNGAMFLTVSNAKKIGIDIFRESSPNNKYSKYYENDYQAHRAIMDVFRKGDLEEECLCLDAHYTLVGERICRAYLRREAEDKIHAEK